MRRTAAVLAIVGIMGVALTAHVWAGAFALLQPTKTSGPAISATIVTVVADTNVPSLKGQTAIRVQKGSSSQAVLYASGYVAAFAFGIGNCVKQGFANVQASTDDRFLGFMDVWVPLTLRTALVGAFGDPTKAAITDIDNATCTVADGRETLSFTATIQFGTL